MSKGIKTITIHDIKKNEEVLTYIAKGNSLLGAMGFTEHGFAHAAKVSKKADEILTVLDYDARTAELAAIASIATIMRKAVQL